MGKSSRRPGPASYTRVGPPRRRSSAGYDPTPDLVEGQGRRPRLVVVPRPPLSFPLPPVPFPVPFAVRHPVRVVVVHRKRTLHARRTEGFQAQVPGDDFRNRRKSRFVGLNGSRSRRPGGTRASLSTSHPTRTPAHAHRLFSSPPPTLGSNASGQHNIRCTTGHDLIPCWHGTPSPSSGVAVPGEASTI
jgi:hypothetical protein